MEACQGDTGFRRPPRRPWNMATYPVVHTKTGEQKEVSMSVHDWDQWCTDNPDWSRDYSDPSTMPGVGEVGEWKDKLRKKNPRPKITVNIF